VVGARNTGTETFNNDSTMTKIIHRYIEKHGLCYATINEVIGVLECAKLELYRMIAAKYEDKKRAENGNISSLNESIV
jgi:hypothetical protein